MRNSHQIAFADTSDITKYSEKLKNVSKNALPRAVKETLNETAFEGRRESINEAKKRFTIRGNKAKGGIFNIITHAQKTTEQKKIDKMASFSYLSNKRRRTQEVVNRMQEQEAGGKLERERMSTSGGRTNKAMAGRVTSKKFGGKALRRITNKDLAKGAHVVRPSRFKKNLKGKSIFMASAYYALKKKKLLRAGTKGRYSYLSVQKGSGSQRYKFETVDSLHRGRNNSVKGQRFVKRGTTIAAKKMPKTFIRHAKRRLDYEMRK